ncbi:MAG: tetratricopeptide repeat protein [Lewinellaceae bacterium]|nr:tetratricopeptide repeat protein [Saprospiraceae bacterium]MCB9338667.1 tetratricopeptide repeat protein [Lewinellaceae bacterium]
MKAIINLLLLIPLACPGMSGTVFDTLKTGTDKEMQIAPILEELRQGLVGLHQAEKQKDDTTLLDACLKMARLYSREHFYSRALAYYQRAEAIAGKSGNQDDQLAIQAVVAETYMQNNQPREAHGTFLSLLSQYEQLDRYDLVVQTLQRLADACVAMENYPKASEYYLQLKALAESKGDKAALPTTLNNLGFAAHQMGDFQKAVDYFSIAEKTAHSSGRVTPGYVFTNLGIAWNNLGDHTRAVENLQEADRRSKGEDEKCRIEHLISSIHLKNKEVYQALRYNESTIKTAQKTRNRPVLCEAYEVASEIYQQLYEYDKALDFYKKHLALKDSLLRDERTQQQALENLHSILEQSENDLLKGMSDDDLRAAEVKQLELEKNASQLEAEKQGLLAIQKDQEIALLKRKQENDAALLRTSELEAKASQQASLLFKQQLEAERKNREIADLNRKQQLDSLESAQQAMEQEQQIKNLQYEAALKELKLREEETFRKNAYALGGLLAAVLLVIFGSWMYSRRLNRRLAEKNAQIELQKQEINMERDRAEGLLLNILPAKVADELKTTGAATPQRYDNVSVMFTDFARFTAMAATLQPEEVLRELNECFLAFDEICERHRLEKIKTIGDSYMCAGGLPVKNNTHPSDTVLAALEILDFIKKRNQQHGSNGHPQWAIRIGIHTGQVVAGVVGSKKFAYDIWGDTVNVASRMESNCPVGAINISEATQQLVARQFRCQYRGEVDVKNKGKMGMYLVEGQA